MAVGLVVALALVFFVAPLASGDPDGLERVAIDQGFSSSADGNPVGRPAGRLRGRGIESDAPGDHGGRGGRSGRRVRSRARGGLGASKAPIRVSGAHAHALHYHGHSPVHRAAPQVKLAGLVAVCPGGGDDPARAVWAFSIYAAIVVSLVGIAEIPPRFFLTRLSDRRAVSCCSRFCCHSSARALGSNSAS